MNLNSHILFALAVGVASVHDLNAAVLIGIGAALPDLDREYILTNRISLAKHQLRRALFHNLFFALGVFLFNPYLGLGVVLHLMLDILTSPTDRGVELFFPLGRLIKEFHLDYDGYLREKSGILWYAEDPLRIIRKTSDKDLTPSGQKSPWIRIYGPFRNSRVADWAVFYSSLTFLVIHNLTNIIPWSISLIRILTWNWALIAGVTLFYGAGEMWRRKLQVSGRGRSMIAAFMLIGGLGFIGFHNI